MKFFKVIKDIFSIPELTSRIGNTLGLLIIFRLGSNLVLPGLNFEVISKSTGSGEGFLGLLDMFVGGGLTAKSIFGLGIMPYISASIIMQLLQVAVPYFQKMQKEGESGRKKFNQITRYFTILICLFQSVAFIALIKSDQARSGMNPYLINENLFSIISVMTLTAGTMFCMWIGEKITDKGIGNGISLLIMVGIIARLPISAGHEFMDLWNTENFLGVIFEVGALFLIIMFTVLITQGVRNIPVSYAKQIVGNKVYNGEGSSIPLKVNTAGVMPIIFAQSLTYLPALFASSVTNPTMKSLLDDFSSSTSWLHTITNAVMIILFTFFYTAIIMHPNEMADNLKRNGGFIPGVKPGEPTADFIDDVLSKITLPGALFVAAIAIIPAFAQMLGVGTDFAVFFGGTSLLILVGVVLDTLQQIESYLLMKQYDGLMEGGKLRGRTQQMTTI